jgi:hypothetical protein
MRGLDLAIAMLLSVTSHKMGELCVQGELEGIRKEMLVVYLKIMSLNSSGMHKKRH